MIGVTISERIDRRTIRDFGDAERRLKRCVLISGEVATLAEIGDVRRLLKSDEWSPILNAEVERAAEWARDTEQRDRAHEYERAPSPDYASGGVCPTRCAERSLNPSVGAPGHTRYDDEIREECAVIRPARQDEEGPMPEIERIRTLTD